MNFEMSAEFNTDSLKGAVPFAQKAALAVLLVGSNSLLPGIETEDIGGADFDANVAARACGSVDLNSRHELLLFS